MDLSYVNSLQTNQPVADQARFMYMRWMCISIIITMSCQLVADLLDDQKGTDQAVQPWTYTGTRLLADLWVRDLDSHAHVYL